jgi:hypothetical protein
MYSGDSQRSICLDCAMTTEHHEDHGSTPAAWTVVFFTTIAFIVGTLGVMMANWVMFWVGAGILIIGAVVGKVMAMAGLGKQRPAHS